MKADEDEPYDLTAVDAPTSPDEVDTLEDRWLVKDLIARNELHAFYGPEGSAKSMLATDIATGVVDRTPVADKFEPERVDTVVYINEEMEKSKFNQRIAGMRQAKPTREPGNLKIYHHQGLKLDTDSGKIEHIVDTHQPDLLIVDTLSEAVRGSLSDQQDMRPVYKNLKEATRDLDCTIIVLGHTNKQEKPFGSVQHQNAVDNLWRFEKRPAAAKTEDDRFVLRHEKDRYNTEGQEIEFTIANGPKPQWRRDIDTTFNKKDEKDVLMALTFAINKEDTGDDVKVADFIGKHRDELGPGRARAAFDDKACDAGFMRHIGNAEHGAKLYEVTEEGEKWLRRKEAELEFDIDDSADVDVIAPKDG